MSRSTRPKYTMMIDGQLVEAASLDDALRYPPS
jgi:hypothetical protein